MHRSIPRIVILGNGLLGSELHKQTSWDIISRTKNKFDITQPDIFLNYFIDLFDGMIATKKYDVIVNCIGLLKPNVVISNAEE